MLKMYRCDITDSRKKLASFLSGWLGGPKLYTKHYGSISIPFAHKHLNIAIEESNAWILCMQAAVDNPPDEATFKTYLGTITYSC